MITAREIPMCAMDHTDPQLLQELLAAVGEVASTGAFTGGSAVEGFESHFANWCGAAHAVGVSSGTEALVLALRALEVGPGDEVVVPANSFIATAEAVSLVGARPRFADVDRETQVVTDQTLAAALTPAVVCVIPVHLFGRTVDMDPIVTLAQDRRLAVIEDCAQAHGASYGGRRVGTIGDVGTFSFYPAKNLGAWGDAGAVVSSRGELTDRVRLLRCHGESPRYHHRVVGTTARLDAIQAAILDVKLRRLEGWNDARRDVAERLGRALEAAQDVIAPPAPARGQDHVYHQFVVRTAHREELRAHLQERGIASAVHYPEPIHTSQAYASLAQDPDVAPVASSLAGEILSLPIFPGMSGQQIERVGDAVCEFASPSYAAASRDPG
jgi:dTDP-3-amino-3,4,6-trideoxy-alpha-D-glucose transaminase